MFKAKTFGDVLAFSLHKKLMSPTYSPANDEPRAETEISGINAAENSAEFGGSSPSTSASMSCSSSSSDSAPLLIVRQSIEKKSTAGGFENLMARRMSKEVQDLLLKMDDDAKLEFFSQLFVGLTDCPNLLGDISFIAERHLRRVRQFGEPFALLPRCLSIKILGYLDPPTLCACMLVCRFWKELCKDTSLWRSFCNWPDSYRLGSPQTERQHLRAHTLADGTIRWKNAFSERYRLWRNWHAGRCVIRTFIGHDQGVSCVQFDAQRIVSGSSDATIRIWDLKSNHRYGVGHMTLAGHSGTVRCLHLHNSRLASGSNDYSIKIWDLAVNPSWSHVACRRTLLGHRNIVRCLQMHGDKVISGSYDQSLKIWSIATGQCVTTLEGSSDYVVCLQYDAEEHRIVSGAADASIRLWDERASSSSTLTSGGAAPSVTCGMTLHNAHDAAVTCVRMDAERIVSGSVDRTIRIWDLRTGRCLQTIDWKQAEGHMGVVRCLQTDSWRIVSAADDKTIKVWKLSNGSRLCTLQGHTDGVTCVQFDDTRIVSGSYDKTVKLWDFSTC